MANVQSAIRLVQAVKI